MLTTFPYNGTLIKYRKSFIERMMIPKTVLLRMLSSYTNGSHLRLLLRHPPQNRVAATVAQVHEPIHLRPLLKKLQCPAGFKRIETSCYYIVKELMEFDQAASNCDGMDAHMFVPQDINEWHEVIALAPSYAWTWTGIVKKGFSQDPEWNGVANSMDISTLPWLVKPYTPFGNGWTELSQCAAYYNTGTESLNYVYYYLCGLSFYSICEANPNTTD
ncbi:carbohydrate binding [Parelaphostrongylus tenuis]|uniref:Carbohydrate binding n=1 Tax=Parelaphostrongylus tenuis TaxID=148309 RepID=A0AAD5WE74_PARTN|nr:carbohydrate binding [Parelaphostrongylus tenuis]